MTTRLLPIINGSNFRELGNYKNINGKFVKMHKLIRSGALNNLTNKDLLFLKNYGVKYDIDLRSKKEAEAYPDKLPMNSKYYLDEILSFDELDDTSLLSGNINDDLLYNSHSGYEHMISIYHKLIKSSHANHAYNKFFSYILENSHDNECLIFHCTEGKDRTGIASILLLNILDIPTEIIKKDYLLTNKFTQIRLNNIISKINEKFQNKNIDILIQNIKYLLTVNENYYQTAINDINEMSGGINNYIKQIIGLSDNDIKDIKEIYLK